MIISPLSVGLLLLASHTVGSGRIEETTAALLATTVTVILTADCATKAVHQARKEQTGTGSPHKSESLDTELGVLTVAVKGVAGLHVDSTKDRVRFHML